MDNIDWLREAHDIISQSEKSPEIRERIRKQAELLRKQRVSSSLVDLLKHTMHVPEKKRIELLEAEIDTDAQTVTFKYVLFDVREEDYDEQER